MKHLNGDGPCDGFVNDGGSAKSIADAPPATLCSECGSVTDAEFLAPMDWEEDRLLTIDEVPPEKRTYLTEEVRCGSCTERYNRRRERQLRRRARSAGARSSSLLTFKQVLNQPPPRWLIEGLVPEGLSVLYGQPGALKSFLALDWACCVATGTAWQGHEVEHGDVLYVAAEGAATMRRRAAAWWDEHNRPNMDRLHVLPEAKNLLNDVAVNELKALVYEVEPVLLIVDTLARSMVGGDENSAKDVGRVVQALDGFARLPRVGNPFGDEPPPTDLNVMARMLVHHTAKDGQMERGSGALRGAADVMLKAERVGPLRTELSCSYIKDAEEFPTITLDGRKVHVDGGESLVLDVVPVFQAAVARADDLRQAVVAFVGEHGPVSRNKVEKGVPGNAAVVASTLDSLVAEGVLIEGRGERNARLYTVGTRSS